MGKGPFFLDLETGAVGTFVRKTMDGCDPGHINVIYVPLGSIFEKRLANRLSATVSDVILPVQTDVAGVQEDGYVLAGVGGYSTRAIFAGIKQFADLKVEELQKLALDKEIEAAMRKAEKEELGRGIDEEVKRIRERQEKLQGTSKKKLEDEVS